MNKTDKEMLDWLKDKTEIFFQENNEDVYNKMFKYKLVPHMKEYMYIFAKSKIEEFHCFVRAFNTTLFSKSGKNVEELFKAAIKFSDERNKLLRRWQQESKTKQEELTQIEEKYHCHDMEYMQSETRSLSKLKFTHPEFIPNYAEASDIKEFLEYADGINYFSLTYGREYLLNLVVDTDRHIIGAIGTFKNTFLFEDYSPSIESLLEDSKVRFNEHWKLMYEANSEAWYSKRIW